MDPQLEDMVEALKWHILEKQLELNVPTRVVSSHQNVLHGEKEIGIKLFKFQSCLQNFELF